MTECVCMGMTLYLCEVRSQCEWAAGDLWAHQHVKENSSQEKAGGRADQVRCSQVGGSLKSLAEVRLSPLRRSVPLGCSSLHPSQQIKRAQPTSFLQAACAIFPPALQRRLGRLFLSMKICLHRGKKWLGGWKILNIWISLFISSSRPPVRGVRRNPFFFCRVC